MIILSLSLLKPLHFCYDYLQKKIDFNFINNLLKFIFFDYFKLNNIDNFLLINIHNLFTHF